MPVFDPCLSHMPSLKVNPFKFLDELPKTRLILLPASELFMVLACVILTACDRQTHTQTDSQMCQ